MHVSKQMFADFEAYWRHLQDTTVVPKGRCTGIPTRKTFNPMRVPKLLPYLFMIEHKSDDTLCARLTGTAIDEVFGLMAPNQNILTLYSEAEQPFVKRVYHNIAKYPCGAVVRRHIILSSDMGFDLVAKSFPLAANNGRIRYSVGMLSADTAHLGTLPQAWKVKGSTLIDFYYLDLGFGIPEDVLPDTPRVPASKPVQTSPVAKSVKAPKGTLEEIPYWHPAAQA